LRWIAQRLFRSVVTTAHRSSSFTQSSLAIPGGCTFGATMHGFFIAAAAFFFWWHCRG
jgi:hypothetical protein